MGDLFATRCATCGRMLVADEFTWAIDDDPSGTARPITRHYRCTVCRDQRGGSEQRHAPLESDDIERAIGPLDVTGARVWARDRFPLVDGAPDLVDELLDLHTPRQLLALTAIMERIEADLRSAPVLAALRLAMLHAILPSSRLATVTGRGASLHVSDGHVRVPSAAQWRERNPWLAFEDGFKTVRGFVQRLEGGALGPLQARLGEDLRALGEGTATAVLMVSSPSAVRALRADPAEPGPGDPDRRAARPARARPAADPPEPRPSRGGVPRHGVGARSRGGRAAADRCPRRLVAARAVVVAGRRARPLARGGRAVDGPGRAESSSWSTAAPRRSRPWPSAAPRPGIRVVVARQADPDDGTGVVELVPPGAALPPGPRTRANVGLPAVVGGPGDPDLVPGRGLFAPPERFDQQPVLRPRGDARRDRGGRRDAPCPRRAGPHRAAVRRDPRRARSVRSAASTGDRAQAARHGRIGRRHPPRRHRFERRAADDGRDGGEDRGQRRGGPRPTTSPTPSGPRPRRRAPRARPIACATAVEPVDRVRSATSCPRPPSGA